jgi:hypothetical protein
MSSELGQGRVKFFNLLLRRHLFIPEFSFPFIIAEIRPSEHVGTNLWDQVFILDLKVRGALNDTICIFPRVE